MYFGGRAGVNNIVYLSQNLSIALNKEKFRGTVNTNYHLTNTSFWLNQETEQSDFDSGMEQQCRWNILSNLILNTDCAYRINMAYRIPIRNPVLINAVIELFLTKRKAFSLQLSVFDLLDQHQFVNLLLNVSTVTKRTTNHICCYLLLIVQIYPDLVENYNATAVLSLVKYYKS
ncbi:hypothetical protein [Arcticibacter sp.]|uniref:hypothetical protein n=1 Tax=Arcticibacter sp. TaxID=1872630 RepID=UPI003890E975